MNDKFDETKLNPEETKRLQKEIYRYLDPMVKSHIDNVPKIKELLEQPKTSFGRRKRKSRRSRKLSKKRRSRRKI